MPSSIVVQLFISRNPYLESAFLVEADTTAQPEYSGSAPDDEKRALSFGGPIAEHIVLAAKTAVFRKHDVFAVFTPESAHAHLRVHPRVAPGDLRAGI